MLFWALLASGQIVMGKVDGWETLDQPIAAETVDLAAQSAQPSSRLEDAPGNFHHIRDITDLLVLEDQQTVDRSFRHCPIFGGVAQYLRNKAAWNDNLYAT